MLGHACKACNYPSDLQRVLQRAAAAATLAAALAGCGSTPRPTEQVEAARAAVAQAQPVAVREGAPELGNAQGKLARAEEAMQRGAYKEARIFAEQAEVDAKYAAARAENARLQRELHGRAR